CYMHLFLWMHYTSFFLTIPATTEIYTLSLHDALPICLIPPAQPARTTRDIRVKNPLIIGFPPRLYVSNGCSLSENNQRLVRGFKDRKSTRLNSSHVKISYAVFCLKKKK